jgi:hypothetical protein
MNQVLIRKVFAIGVICFSILFLFYILAIIGSAFYKNSSITSDLTTTSNTQTKDSSSLDDNGIYTISGKTRNYIVSKIQVQNAVYNYFGIDTKSLTEPSGSDEAFVLGSLSPDETKIAVQLINHGIIDHSVLLIKSTKASEWDVISSIDSLEKWSADSAYLAFTAKPTEIGSARLRVLDTNTLIVAETEESPDIDDCENRAHSDFSWREDNRSLDVKYRAVYFNKSSIDGRCDVNDVLKINDNESGIVILKL